MLSEQIEGWIILMLITSPFWLVILYLLIKNIWSKNK